jgi:segregation and condensation protein A
MICDIFLRLKDFEGPFDLLVERVRRHEIDIVEVCLLEVARRLAEELLPNPDLMRFTPFFSLSRLLFLKSRNLLPGQDPFAAADLDDEERIAENEEAPTKVRERLIDQYQTFQSVRETFRKYEEENAKRIRSYQTRAAAAPSFIDEIDYLEEVTPFDLMYTMAQIVKRGLEDRSYHVKVDDSKLLSDRIREVFDFIFERRGDVVRFSEIVARTPQKPEAVLSFLALVYLVSQGKVMARQNRPYGDIVVTAGAAAGGNN